MIVKKIVLKVVIDITADIRRAFHVPFYTCIKTHGDKPYTNNHFHILLCLLVLVIAELGGTIFPFFL